MKKPKIAVIHDYLNQYGGAEKTLEAILEIFPEAPIYTGIYDPKKLPKTITKRAIVPLTGTLLRVFPKYFTFLMPLVFENLDLSAYDLIISDGTAWPKGVITAPEQLHISYIHTPPRFLYKYSVESTKRFKWYFKPVIPLLDHFLRIWDYNAAQRPDFLLANSQEVQKRIQKFYGRQATVIYPPVETETKEITEGNGLKKPYFVAIGRLAAYKNFDLLINAFNLLDIPLTIIGTGLEEKKLKNLANKNITFTGYVSDEEKKHILAKSMGLINPVVDEDLGIVPIEACSFGIPVLAHKSGGHLETIRPGINGMFFDKTDLESLTTAIRQFKDMISKGSFNPAKIKMTAQKFGKERFKKEFATFVWEKWEERARTTGSNNNSN